MSHFYLQMDHSSDLLSVSNYLFKIFSSIYSSRAYKNQNSYFLSSRKIYIYLEWPRRNASQKKVSLFPADYSDHNSLYFVIFYFALAFSLARTYIPTYFTNLTYLTLPLGYDDIYLRFHFLSEYIRSANKFLTCLRIKI